MKCSKIGARGTLVALALWFLDGGLVHERWYMFAAPAVGAEPAWSDPPVADAGDDQAVTNPNYEGILVTLDAGGSTDDGAILEYRWLHADDVLAAGPTPTTHVALSGGVYDLTLIVTDDAGLTDTDTCQVVVTDAIAPIPIDDLAGPFAVQFGDLFGTGTTDAAILVSEEAPFTIISETTWMGADPDALGAGHFHFVFDRVGNLYYVTDTGYLTSFGPTLNHRWHGHDADEGLVTIGNTGNNSITVGQRWVYVAGLDDDLTPAVFAFDKATGELRWRVDLVDEQGQPVEDAGFVPKMTLYENKLYVVGQVGVEEENTVRIYQVDCGTDASDGTLDGSSLVLVNLCGQMPGGPCESNAGNLVLLPNVFGTGEHGLYWNQLGSPDADAWPDLAAVRVTPATATATPAWGAFDFSGPRLWRSHVLAHPDQSVFYTPSSDSWYACMYTWDALQAQMLAEVPSAVGSDHSLADVYGLDLSVPGQPRVHAGGAGGSLVTYIDEFGDGTSLATEKRFYDLHGATHFYPAAALILGDGGAGPVLVTGTWIPDGPAPAEGPHSHIMALDLSEPPPDPDDGPFWIDNIVVTHEGEEIFREDFEGLELGADVTTSPVWFDAGSGGMDTVAVVVEKDGSQVALMDPYGTDFPYVYAGIVADLGDVYLIHPGATITVAWDQWRDDLTDIVHCHLYNPDADFGIYQMDDLAPPEAAIGYQNEAGWAPPAAPLATHGERQQVVMTIAAGTYDISVDGQEWDGEDGSADVSWFGGAYGYSEFHIRYYATPATSSRSPVLAEFDANWDADEGAGYGRVEAVSVGPDGTVYYMQSSASGRRITRLGALPAGPAVTPGDLNCDGLVDFFDIDAFVLAITDPATWEASYDCPLLNGDCNFDGLVDFFDIDPFVSLVVGKL